MECSGQHLTELGGHHGGIGGGTADWFGNDLLTKLFMSLTFDSLRHRPYKRKEVKARRRHSLPQLARVYSNCIVLCYGSKHQDTTGRNAESLREELT